MAALIRVCRGRRLVDQAEIFPCPTPNLGAGVCETTVAIFLTHDAQVCAGARSRGVTGVTGVACQSASAAVRVAGSPRDTGQSGLSERRSLSTCTDADFVGSLGSASLQGWSGAIDSRCVCSGEHGAGFVSPIMSRTGKL